MADDASGGSVQADLGLLIKAEQDVDAVADRLTSMMNTLMNRLAPLQEFWVGAGGRSFQDVRQRFDEDMARLNVALRSIAEAVGTSGRDYTVSDQEVQSEMQRAGATAGQITQALTIN